MKRKEEAFLVAQALVVAGVLALLILPLNSANVGQTTSSSTASSSAALSTSESSSSTLRPIRRCFKLAFGTGVKRTGLGWASSPMRRTNNTDAPKPDILCTPPSGSGRNLGRSGRIGSALDSSEGSQGGNPTRYFSPYGGRVLASEGFLFRASYANDFGKPDTEAW